MLRPHTPGVGGYLVAYAVSVLVFPCLWLVPVAPLVLTDPGEHLSALLGGWLIVLVYTAVVSVPFAVVGIPLVHLVARRAETQAAQVAITGAVTVALFAVPTLVLGDGETAFVGLVLGLVTSIATMIGRAAVVPLVRRRAAVEPTRGRPTSPALSSYDDSSGDRRR